MSRERKKFEGSLTAYLIAWIVRAMPFVNLKIDPDTINPWREEPALSPEMVKLKEWQAQRRWDLMFGSKKRD